MSAGAGSQDEKTMFNYCILAIIFAFIPWFIVVHNLYAIPRRMFYKAYYYSILATPNNPYLIAALIFGFIFSSIFFYILFEFNRTNFGGASYQQRLRGPKMVSHLKLKVFYKSFFYPQLKICGIPLRQSVENLHALFSGSTGGGKTVAMCSFVESVQERGRDRIISVDPNGGYMRHFFQEGDVILNPFDARSSGWSIFNEINSRFDIDNFSVALIPKSASTDQEQWNSYARVLVSQTMLKIWENYSEDTDGTAELFFWLIEAEKDQLYDFLKGTVAPNLFDADGMYTSVKGVLTQYIKPHEYLKRGNFSIRKYLEESDGNLWITWTENQLEALKPLISCWIDVICAAILSMPDLTERQRIKKSKILNQIILLLDEMGSVEKLNYLVQLLLKGRKHGVICIFGIQSLAQLNLIYGEQEAQSLRNCLGTIVVCQLSSGDTYTAPEFSKVFGEHEVTRYQNSISMGTGGGKGTRSLQKEREPIIMPSEISGMDSLIFFMKFAQSNYVCKHQLVYKDREIVTEGFILADNKWTEINPWRNHAHS